MTAPRVISPAEVRLLLDLGGIRLWFDASGPSLLPQGETVAQRPTLVAVHGGPGLDHINMKQTLAPLTDNAQIIFYDQRGHGRSDHSRAEFWNLPTWADDLRRLCDALGLTRPSRPRQQLRRIRHPHLRRDVPRPPRRHHPGQHHRRTDRLPRQRRDLPPTRRRRSRRGSVNLTALSHFRW